MNVHRALFLGTITLLGCSRTAVPPQSTTRSSREEREAEKARYVAELQHERRPLKGWTKSEWAGAERAWGRIPNPWGQPQVAADVDAQDPQQVRALLLSSQMSTRDMLFGPPPDALRQLLESTAGIIQWLVTGDTHVVFAESITPRAANGLASFRSRLSEDYIPVKLRVTADGGTYPDLDIQLEREPEGSPRGRMAAAMRRRYQLEIPFVHGGVITAEVAVPITTATGRHRDLRFECVFDSATAAWIAGRLEIRMDSRTLREQMDKARTEEDRRAFMVRLRADKQGVSFLGVSPAAPLVAAGAIR